MLTFYLFAPAVGALLIAMLPRDQENNSKYIALSFSFLAFVTSIITFISFDASKEGYQFVDNFNWITSEIGGFNIQYVVGIDGLSSPLILLLGMLSVVSILISFNVQYRQKEYFIWLLILQTAIAGVFLSLDLIQFFLFWELELLPMYMLINTWGSGRKHYSAMKFLIYTLAGSAVMLVAFLIVGFEVGTFNIETIISQPPVDTFIPLSLLFWAIMLAFLVKLPVFPVHTWLPDAHTDAPTAVSVMLAGVLLKMGGYGILRIAVPIFPSQAYEFRTILAVLAAFTVIYGAIITLQQKDLKRLIAYSSVSHMGYVLLGIAAFSAVGMSGAALQMFTHGTITGLLFVMVGMVYERTHTRQIAEMQGLMHYIPRIATVMLIAGLASLGVPGLSGFVAELTTFLGAYEIHPISTVVAVFGVVLAAGYILWTFQRVFHGPPDNKWESLTDANQWWEYAAMALLVISIVGVGIYPSIITESIEHGIEPIAKIIEAVI